MNIYYEHCVAYLKALPSPPPVPSFQTHLAAALKTIPEFFDPKLYETEFARAFANMHIGDKNKRKKRFAWE